MKTYTVTEAQALAILEELYECAAHATPEADRLWAAFKVAFPGLKAKREAQRRATA